MSETNKLDEKSKKKLDKYGKCLPSYPLVEYVPSKDQLLGTVFPSNVFGSLDSEYFRTFSSTLSKLNSDDNMTALVQTTVKTVTAAVAGIFGADAAPNLIFTITDASVMAVQIFDTIVKIVAKAEKVITKIEKKASKIKSVANKVDDDMLRLIFDIMNIEFTDGIVGVKCHIKYLLKEYRKKGVKITVLCELFKPIYNSMIKFIGSVASTAMPGSFGAPRAILENLAKSKLGRRVVIGLIISKVTNYYNMIKKNRNLPEELRNMFEDPDIMAKYIQCIIANKNCPEKIEKETKKKSKKGSSFSFRPQLRLGISLNPKKQMMKVISTGAERISGVSRIIAENIPAYQESMVIISDGSGMFAYMVSKMFAVSIALLYVFQACP